MLNRVEKRSTARQVAALVQRGFGRCLLLVAIVCPVAACSGGTGSTATGGRAGDAGTGGAGTGGAGTGGTTTVSGTGGRLEPSGSGGVNASGTGGVSVGASGGALGSGGGINASGGATGSGGLVAGTGGGAAGQGAGGNSDGAGGGPAIVDLFNGTDLTGFDVYRETQATSPGTLLTGADALKIFKVEGGTIRVYGDAADKSTQARHTMMTKGSYTKYNLWWEYKWGTKKYAPYTDLTMYPRDAGVLWHIHNDRTQVWPSSIEFQNKDGTTGDIFALYARCTSLAQNGGTTFVEGGTSKLVDGSTGFVQHGRSANFEIADWNALQLQVSGGTAVYIVNGHIVNRVLSVTDKTGKAITAGPIAWQAEHAEVFYRNMRIQVLP